jgi:L-amino acid N-acyltransferase YncA
MTYHSDIVRQERLLALYRPILERVLDRVDLVIASSPDMVEHSEFLKRVAEKCRVVPFGIHAESYADTPEVLRRAEELGSGHSRPIVLFVGRLIYYKGADVLVKAMADVEADLVMIGRGPLEAELRDLASSSGIADRVTFLEGDLFGPVNGRAYDVIVSNPPYIADAEFAALDRGVREFEPRSALAGGPDGLAFFRRIAADAAGHRGRRSGEVGVEPERIRRLLDEVAAGEVSPEAAYESLSHLPFAETAGGAAHVDHHRGIRTGFPEVVFCEGKTPQQVRSIARELLEHGDVMLGTRASAAQFQVVAQIALDARYFEEARILLVDRRETKPSEGHVVIASAGTADHPVVVAVEGGEVLAFGALSPYRTKPSYRHTVEDSVYVKPGYRGKGLGGLILDELVTLARGRGHHAVVARITGGNVASLRLHERHGFIRAGLEREVAFKLGAWLDVVTMQRLLEPPGHP